MWFAIVLVFIAMPLVELALLLVLSQYTSLWVTLAVVILTGVLGGGLAKWQGLRTVRKIREQMRDGQMPAGAVLDGMMILIAALLLLTPGLITDVVGVSLLIPPVRELYKRWGGRLIARQLHLPMITTFVSPDPQPKSTTRPGEPMSASEGPTRRPSVLEGTATKRTANTSVRD